MTIKEKLKQIKEKYNLPYVDYFKQREFYSSGPGTGKGSKGTKYIYTFSTAIKKPNKKVGTSVFTNSIEELENEIIRIMEMN